VALSCVKSGRPQAHQTYVNVTTLFCCFLQFLFCTLFWYLYVHPQNIFSASFFADLMSGWGRHLTQLPIDVPYLALKVYRENAKQTSLNAAIVLWIQNYIFGIQICFRRGISFRSGWAIISGLIGFESVIFVSKKFQFWIRMSINFR
jgi:hypothetical protein